MYVVTGGAGFIGSNLLSVLEARGLGPLAVIDRCDSAHKQRNIAKRTLTATVAPELCLSFLAENAGKIRGLFHLGAITSTTERNLELLEEVNVRLSRALWTWCARNSVPFIYASSAATYGDGEDGFDDDGRLEALSRLKPLNPYGASKHAFDLWVAQQAAAGADQPPRWAGLKFFNVYGPNEFHKGSQSSLVSQMYPAAAKGEPYTLFRSHNPAYADGEQLRDFIFVDDCCDVMIWLMLEARNFDGGAGALFNLGSGRARTFLDLAAAVYGAAGQPLLVNFRDTPQDIRGQYQYFTEAKMDRLRAAGYAKAFTTLEDGVQTTIARALSQPDPYR